MKTAVDAAMKAAENRQAHKVKIPRAQVAQEYEDRGGRDVAESLCLQLKPDARMRAKGEVSRWA